MNNTKENGEYDHIEALIFDLDGVITRTRVVHEKAWREMFSRFFIAGGYTTQTELTENDYVAYIDGKPRYQGVRSFLLSRNIKLPLGSPHDAPGFDTVCALGNLKNQLFNEVLQEQGAEIYTDAVDKLKYWHMKGIPTAIVSSSKNCRKIIQVAGIEHLFDVRVDGEVSEERGLRGKPDPDIFLEAARQLHVNPSRCVIFEDAISGVMAGQKGFFGLVVGVNRFDQAKTLLANGADIVIDNFHDFTLTDRDVINEYFPATARHIFPYNKVIFSQLSSRKLIIFLDYDGTLTPIVARPEQAVISPEMKESLHKLSEIATVAIVTGRDKEDVEQFIGLKNLIYAGSHGFIITGPDNLFLEHPDAETIVPRLDEIEKELSAILPARTHGTQLDRKRFAIGIHYRNAPEGDEAVVNDIAREMLEKFPGHKLGGGKKIVEIKPDIDWHKGKAVEWIWKKLDSEEKSLPLYIGDDLTDEDAFVALKGKGIGILVGGHGNDTAADYFLKNVYQVNEFFKRIIEGIKVPEKT